MPQAAFPSKPVASFVSPSPPVVIPVCVHSFVGKNEGTVFSLFCSGAIPRSSRGQAHGAFRWRHKMPPYTWNGGRAPPEDLYLPSSLLAKGGKKKAEIVNE